MDDWDADPAPTAAKNHDEARGAATAALPLPDDDDNFGAPSPLKKANTVVTVTEVAPTPAASGDDEDWDMGDTSAPSTVPVASGGDDGDWDATVSAAPAAYADGNEFGGGGGFGAPAPVATQDDAFGGGGGFDAPALVAAQGDAFEAGGGNGGAFGAPAAAQDGFSAVAAPPPAVKKKRVLDKNLRPPEKSKAFADFFVPQHSEQYEDPVPDPREMPLRRNETHNLYSKELAMSVAAGADKLQEDTQKKTKKKFAIHYNGNRITSSHLWTDYQVRLLLGLINRNIHTAGKPEGIDKATKRTVIERRKMLNDNLPKATDGHTHIGQWAYHDVAELLNNDIDRSNIPVVDVRDMIHRLVDERKGGQLVAHRFKAPHLTHRIVVAWKRKQDFVGDRKEWLGDKEREGRKFILARQKEESQQASEEVVYNPGRVVSASGADADVVAVRSGWAQGVAVNAFGGDAEAVPEVVAPVESGDFSGFGGPAPAAAPAVVAEWDDEDDGDVAPATVLPSIETGEWDAEDQALAAGLAAYTEATPAPAPAKAPCPAKVTEPLGDFGLADPFSAPLPGNTGFQNAAPAAPAAVPVAERGEDDAPAAPAAGAAPDEWDEDDSAPVVVQPTNTDAVMADASSTGSNVVEPATGSDAGGEWDEDDDAAPAAPSIPTTSGTTIPKSNTRGSLDVMMDNTNITSPTATSYQSSGFTAVNAPLRAPPTSAPTSAPAPAYTIDPNTGFNPERLALLAAKGDREDTPPEREKRDPWAGAGESASVEPKNEGVSGFNAMPLAFNRLTGERADPAVVTAAAAKAAVGAGARTPLGVTQGNGTPLPAVWGDSPKDVEMGGGDDWGAGSPRPAAVKPIEKAGDKGDAADDEDAAQENNPKEKKYVDLNAGWDAAGADDVKLDY